MRAVWGEEPRVALWLPLIGHPFTALLIATLGTFYFLGIRLGMPAAEVQRIAERALDPAGVILLATGAGGVLKQVLIDSGAGQAVAASLAAAALPTVVVACLVAAVIRVLQGSETVAMITAAGLVPPLIVAADHPEPFAALVTIAIAAGILDNPLVVQYAPRATWCRLRPGRGIAPHANVADCSCGKYWMPGYPPADCRR